MGLLDESCHNGAEKWRMVRKNFNSKNYDVILADRKKEKLKKLIDLTVDLTTNFEEAVRDADQIFLCVSITRLKNC